jgi:hypothetical protein
VSTSPRLGSDNVQHLSQEIRDRASGVASDVSDRAKTYYYDAGGWMQQNYGKALIGVGVLAVAGLFGFFLSRRNRFEPEVSDVDQNIDRGYGSI